MISHLALYVEAGWFDRVRSRRGGRQVLQAFIIAPVIVVLDEAADVGFEVAWQRRLAEAGV